MDNSKKCLIKWQSRQMTVFPPVEPSKLTAKRGSTMQMTKSWPERESLARFSSRKRTFGGPSLTLFKLIALKWPSDEGHFSATKNGLQNRCPRVGATKLFLNKGEIKGETRVYRGVAKYRPKCLSRFLRSSSLDRTNVDPWRRDQCRLAPERM